MSAPTPPQPPPGYVSPQIRRDFALAKLVETAAEILIICKPLIEKAVQEALTERPRTR